MTRRGHSEGRACKLPEQNRFQSVAAAGISSPTAGLSETKRRDGETRHDNEMWVPPSLHRFRPPYIVMLDENPYKAPTEVSKQGQQPRLRDQRPSADEDKEIRYAQLGLRLLGVLFLIEGVGGILGSLTYVVIQSSQMQRAGFEPFPDAYAFGWFAGSAALLVAGIYFVVGGRYVLESVFLPSSSARDIGDADDAIGSSGG